MKRNLLIFSLLFVAFAAMLQSCSDDETYADKRKRENKQINAFLQSGTLVMSEDSPEDTLLYAPGNIKVISEDQFYRNDSTTNVATNEYVYFSRTGVYMQIVSKGVGTKIASGDSWRVLTRYTEFNIASDTIQTSNKTVGSEMSPDVMIISNTSGSFTGTFTSGTMFNSYKSSAVPPAWLIPLTYINLGRLNSADAELAHVRLIVPGAQGQANASSNVYPCYYDITYQRGR